MMFRILTSLHSSPVLFLLNYRRLWIRKFECCWNSPLNPSRVVGDPLPVRTWVHTSGVVKADTRYPAYPTAIAGVSLQEISGSKTSVFTGTFVKDYHEELLSDPLRLPRHLILGNYAAMAANRISYFLNLKGPSAAVDTGCSTSTVGLHLACQSLRTGESDYAIVGGANVLLGPDSFVNLSNLG